MKETMEQIRSNIGVDTISKKSGVYTVRKAFFYRHGNSEDTVAQKVLKAYPLAQIVDKGEKWVDFVGGASIANQSHWYVKFILPTEATLPRTE